MNKKFVISLGGAICLLSGCASSIQVTTPILIPTQTPVPVFPEDEYQVYSAFIKYYVKEFTVDDFAVAYVPDTVVIMNETFDYVFGDDTLDYVSDLITEADEEVFVNFSKINSKSQTLENQFDLPYGYLLVSEEELGEVLKDVTGDNYYELFYDAYPNSQGLLTLSGIGFNNEKNQALFYYEANFTFMNFGEFIFLQKNDSGWVVKDGVMDWIE